MQKSKEILSIIFLLSFGFFFAHSELNFLSEDVEGHHQNSHDYCEIVKEARIEKTNNLQKDITSRVILYNNNDCCTECKQIEDILQNTEFTSTKIYYNTQTFLINKTLLI